MMYGEHLGDLLRQGPPPLVGGGRRIPERRMPAVLVGDSCDVLEQGEAGGVTGREAPAGQPLACERGDEVLRQGVVEAIASLPLPGAYAASKHAVEGQCDASRRELPAAGALIPVASVEPATIDVPFFANARTKMGLSPGSRRLTLRADQPRGRSLQVAGPMHRLRRGC